MKIEGVPAEITLLCPLVLLHLKVHFSRLALENQAKKGILAKIPKNSKKNDCANHVILAH